MSALLSRTRPSIPLVRVKALWKHPIRCVSLLGEKTVPLAFDKIETSKTHHTQHDHHHSKHTGAIVFVHGLLYVTLWAHMVPPEPHLPVSSAVRSKIGDP